MKDPDQASNSVQPVAPAFGEAFRFWVKLGFISFGGPAGQIAVMQSELVERKRWISQERFLHALNYCMLLPGPEATQLAIYIGWLLHKTPGGIVAGAFFVIPSTLVLWSLSYIYVTFGKLAWVAAIFYGLKPAVVAIVAAAVLRIGSKALKNEVMWALAAIAFIAIYFFHLPFPLIIATAAAVGLIGGKLWREKFLVIRGHGASKNAELSVLGDSDASPEHTVPSFARAFKVLSICLILWWTPVFALGALFGHDHALFREGIFFSKAAMVTFGGAYAVLPYVSQQAVETFQWLTPHQMLDGLGMAETTPGPLIIVLQFVGFMGGWSQPGGLHPLVAATLGAFISTWTTFLPCFLWIFLGAPHIEQLRGRDNLTSALSAVTAAVVGVVLNLAVWFGLQVLFPGFTADWFSIAVAAVAFAAMAKYKWEIIPVVTGAGIAGLLWRTIIVP